MQLVTRSVLRDFALDLKTYSSTSATKVEKRVILR